MDDKFKALKTVNDLTILNGQAFEKYLTQLFSELGYDAKKTPGSGDYGADLILEAGGVRTVVQAKQHSADVGFDAVKEVHFAKTYYKADEAWVVCTGKFTRQARKAAQLTDVVLHDGSWLEDALRLHRSGGKLIESETRHQAEKGSKSIPVDAGYQAVLDRIAVLRENEQMRIDKMSEWQVACALGLGNEFERLQRLRERASILSARTGVFDSVESDLEAARNAVSDFSETIALSEKRETDLKQEIDDYRFFGRRQGAQSKRKLKKEHSLLCEAIADQELKRAKARDLVTYFEARQRERDRLIAERLEIQPELQELSDKVNKEFEERAIRNVYDDVMTEFTELYRSHPSEALESFDSVGKIKARAQELDGIEESDS